MFGSVAIEVTKVGFDFVMKLKSVPRTTGLGKDKDSPGGDSTVTFRSKLLSWFLKLRSLK